MSNEFKRWLRGFVGMSILIILINIGMITVAESCIYLALISSQMVSLSIMMVLVIHFDNKCGNIL